MKKNAIILLAVLMLASAMVSCADPAYQNNKPDADKPGGIVTGANTSADTETNEPEAPKTTEKAEAVSLNTDLLDEYKMTFGELTEKHGKVVGYEVLEGGSHYLLENGYGYYFFNVPWNNEKTVKDEDGDFYYMPINDNELCRGVRNISPEVLFFGDFDTLSIDTIAKIDGLNYKSTDEDGIVTPRAYASHFTYDGWDSNKVELYIYHENRDVIDKASEVRIYIHPMNIEAEENQ